MRPRTLYITVLFLLSLFTAVDSSAETLDQILERIDLSGFLRIRGWSILSRTYVTDTFQERATYKHINYFDLFFRNRIDLKIIPEVEIKTVFDISANFGKSDFSLGQGGTNLITRDVYAIFRPHASSEISVGLKPFSLPGGYILARDATGIQYDLNLLKKKVNPYLIYIKAFDDADDSFGQGSDMPDYIWDDILIAGSKFNIASVLSTEAYYVYEDDRYTSGNGLDGDNRKASLHWAGIHNKIIAGNWFLKIGGIINFGYMYVRGIDKTVKNYLIASGLSPALNDGFSKISLMSGLLEFETGYGQDEFQFSLSLEGATGDPDNACAGISFQDIKASHGYSYIVIDDTGGIALRGSGESCWYGLYGSALNLQYTILDSVTLKMKYIHYRTTKTLYWTGKGTTWFGDEVNINAEYKYRDIVSLTLSAAGFLPQRAYSAQEKMSNDYWGLLPASRYNFLSYDNYSSRSMIFELMLGVQVSYD